MHAGASINHAVRAFLERRLNLFESLRPAPKRTPEPGHQRVVVHWERLSPLLEGRLQTRPTPRFTEDAEAEMPRRFRFLRQFRQGVTIPASLGQSLRPATTDNPNIPPGP